MQEPTFVHVHSSLPARPSILRSTSTSDVSTTSIDSKASSITFAPLPSIDTRKPRRHGQPLGLATRGEMLRKSRRSYGETATPQYASSEDQELPLPDLGKLVKGLWRSVSRGHGEKQGTANETQRPISTTTLAEGITESRDHDGGQGGVWMEEVTWATASDASTTLSCRDVISTISPVDSGSFLDDLDGIEKIQTKEHNLATEGERKEFGGRGAIHRDLG